MSQIDFHPVRTKEEIKTLAALAKQIWEQHFTPIIGEAQVAYMVEKFQSEKALTDQIAQGYHYFLFEIAGEYVGFTGIHPEEGKLFLSKLYLKKECRKRGFAREAFRFLVQYCKDNGLSAIWLTVNRHNTDTIEVYRHLGFVTTREQKADIGGGFYMDDYIMEFPIL